MPFVSVAYVGPKWELELKMSVGILAPYMDDIPVDVLHDCGRKGTNDPGGGIALVNGFTGGKGFC